MDNFLHSSAPCDVVKRLLRSRTFLCWSCKELGEGKVFWERKLLLMHSTLSFSHLNLIFKALCYACLSNQMFTWNFSHHQIKNYFLKLRIIAGLMRAFLTPLKTMLNLWIDNSSIFLTPDSIINMHVNGV